MTDHPETTMIPNETLRQFLAEHGIDTDYVTVVEETEGEDGNVDGDPVRYRFDLDRQAPREDIVAFYRMQAVNLVNTNGERTWVFADHVDELLESESSSH